MLMAGYESMDMIELTENINIMKMNGCTEKE